VTNEDLEEYLRAAGHNVETIVGADRRPYLVIHEYQITTGTLVGRTCDVAIERVTTIPYVPPSAIHTRPALVPMDMTNFRTKRSQVGPEWQYWSRVLRVPPTPRAIATHVATIFSEV